MTPTLDQINKDLAEFMGEHVTWKPVDIHAGYYIGDNGSVASTKYRKPRILKIHVCNSGYYKTTFSIKGKSKNYMVHSLVARYFIGSRAEGYQVNHKDGDKLNNNLSNLEYVTQYENMAHTRDMGLLNTPTGERSGSAKLTNKKVKEIRMLWSLSKVKILAHVFNVDESTVYNIMRSATWKAVKELK